MRTPPPSARTEVRRKPQRAAYERATIDAFVDEAFFCQVAFNEGGSVHCLPTSCWRVGDHLYIHGAPGSRMAQTLTTTPCAVSIVHLDGLVFARSARAHSMNYRSVTIYGQFEAVDRAEEKRAAFDAFVDHVSPGRAARVRAPSEAEIAVTQVLRIPLAEAAAKARTGGVVDAPGDLAQPVWAGVIPLALRAGEAQADVPTDEALPALPVFMTDR